MVSGEKNAVTQEKAENKVDKQITIYIRKKHDGYIVKESKEYF